MEANEPAVPREARSLPEVIGAIAGAMARQLPAGDIAQLRRLQPGEIGGLAFFKVAATYLRPRGFLTESGEALDRAERSWAAILSAVAFTHSLHSPGKRLGHALAAAGMSELRLVRLLRAHDEALLDNVRLVGRYLLSKGEAVDLTELARLVLTDGGRHEENIRRNVARDFYDHIAD